MDNETVTNNETIELDLDRMTLGELEAIEEIAGTEGFQRLMEGQTSAKVLIAVAYIVKRRDNPAFTMDDARSIRVMAFQPPEESPGKAEGNGA